MEEEDCVEALFKIVVVGGVGTGKTSIFQRFIKNEFPYEVKSTIGV
jgi:GTPase SAR1 family protein